MQYKIIRTPEGLEFVPVNEEKVQHSVATDYPKAAHPNSMADANLAGKPVSEIGNLMEALSTVFGVAPDRSYDVNRDDRMPEHDKYHHKDNDSINIHRGVEAQPVPVDPAEFLDMLMGMNRSAQVRKNPTPCGLNTESADAMEFLKMLGLNPVRVQNSTVKDAPVAKNPKLVFEMINILGPAVKVGQRVICNVMEKENHDILIGVVSNTMLPFPVCFKETNIEKLINIFGDYIPTEFVATVTAVHGNICEVEIDMEAVAKHKDVIPGFHVSHNNQDDEVLARILGEFQNAAILRQFKTPNGLSPENAAKWDKAYKIYLKGLGKLMLDVAKALDA